MTNKCAPILLLKIFMVCVFSTVTFYTMAQHLSYTSVPVTDKYYNISYTIGYQDNKVFFWFYDNSDKTLHLNIFDDNMRLTKEASFKIEKMNEFYKINFFKRNDCYNVLMEYSSGKNNITQLFAFNSAKDAIAALPVLEKADAKGGELTVKNSDNGKYIGLLKQYQTVDDSTLIFYSVYNDQYEHINTFTFLLPQINPTINLGSSLIDNSGNLFFAAQDVNRSSNKSNVTIYEVNLQTDSLLTSNFFRNGEFSNISIQQNNTNSGLAVSGLWSNDQRNELQNKYFFLVQFNKNLLQEGGMALFSIKKITDSLCSNKFFVSSVNGKVGVDSNYNLYLSGVTNIKSKKNGLHFSPVYSQPDLSAITSTMHSFYDGRATPNDLGNLAASNVPNVYNNTVTPNLGSYNTAYGTSYPNTGNYFSPNTGESYKPKTWGNNFFIWLVINPKGVVAIHDFKNNESGSLPESDRVFITDQHAHYFYSRTIKGSKQLLFDLVCEHDGKMQLKPVVSNARHTLQLQNGIQVSPSIIVFPVTDIKYSLWLAKMNVE